MALNPRQLVFARLVLAGVPASQAYRRAGYQVKSDRAAESAASLLLRNVEVNAIIDTATEKALASLDVTAERVVRELARLAFSDPRKLYRADGTLKPPPEWDADTAAAVAAVETQEQRGRGGGDAPVVLARRVRWWDKRAALELLGRHLGLFRERVEVSGPGGGPLAVEEIVVRTRAEAAAVLAALPVPAGGG